MTSDDDTHVSAGGHPDDERLLEELRAIARAHDPVPPLVAAAAKASLTWRTVDAELAELLYDSALDEERLAAVRGPETSRLLTFGAPAVTIEVEVSGSGESRRVVGQLVPAQPATVEIRHRDGVVEARAGDDGHFHADDVPAGPLSFRCRLGDGGTTVQSDWFAL